MNTVNDIKYNKMNFTIDLSSITYMDMELSHSEITQLICDAYHSHPTFRIKMMNQYNHIKIDIVDSLCITAELMNIGKKSKYFSEMKISFHILSKPPRKLKEYFHYPFYVAYICSCQNTKWEYLSYDPSNQSLMNIIKDQPADLMIPCFI